MVFNIAVLLGHFARKGGALKSSPNDSHPGMSLGHLSLAEGLLRLPCEADGTQYGEPTKSPWIMVFALCILFGRDIAFAIVELSHRPQLQNNFDTILQARIYSLLRAGSSLW